MLPLLLDTDDLALRVGVGIVLAFLVVLGGAALWWVVSARKWFTGPKVQGSAEELAAVEQELKEIG